MEVNSKKAKNLLRQGEIIAVPTETVFGMAVDMYNEEAVLNLFNLKGRSIKKPFVIQVSRSEEILPFLSYVPFDLEKITRVFWPGPLTLVLPVNEQKMPGLIRGHLPTAAFRVTQNESTRNLIEEYGPLAITSANKSGKETLLSPREITQQFGENFPVLENKESCAAGVPSTILAYIDASWVVLRLGALSIKDLAKVIGYFPPVVSNYNYQEATFTLRTQLHLMDVPYDGMVKTVLGFTDREYPSAENVINLGRLAVPKEISKNICFCLKKIQQERYPHVWVDMDFPKIGPLKELAALLERSIRTGI